VAELRFSWDPQKARSNERNHGVSFEEAQTVFFDEHAAAAPGVPLPSRGQRVDSDHQRSASEQARGEAVLGKAETMKKEYDFSRARKNPYAKRLKKQITIRLDEPTIEYFKGVAELSGIPYQTLINLYLRDCAQKGRKLSMDWRAAG